MSTMSTATNQIDQLVSAIDKHGSPACVGIDPVFSMLPQTLCSGSEAESVAQFSLGVLDAIKGTVPAIKPQSACFERYGSVGYAILETVIAKGRELGFVVILDAKRGDIGSSAQHYAQGAADMGAHFITVSPYMGPSTIEPFLDAGLGVFALARTSNPDSDEVQLNELADGRRVVHAIGSMIAKLGSTSIAQSGLSALGAVVGATKAADEMGTLRELMPNQMFLVPGVGAQGGTVDDVRPMCRPGAGSSGQLGVIVNASRSVLFPNTGGSDWQQNIRQAAIDFADSLRSLAN